MLAGPWQQVCQTVTAPSPSTPSTSNGKGKGRAAPQATQKRQQVDICAILDQLAEDQQQELIDELVKRMGE